MLYHGETRREERMPGVPGGDSSSRLDRPEYPEGRQVENIGHSPTRTSGSTASLEASFLILYFGNLCITDYLCRKYICDTQTTMRKRQLYTKKKAPNGQGRQAKIKHLPLPEEVVQDLQRFKDAYSIRLSRKVTWEQMFRRWMDHVGRFDPDVKEYVCEGKKCQKENPPVPSPSDQEIEFVPRKTHKTFEV